MIYFYISTTSLTWWVSLLVDTRVPEGTCSQVLRSTSVDWFVAFRELQKFSCWNLLELLFLGFIHDPFWLQYVVALLWYLFSFFSFFVWLRITDDGSVLEMGIWSILLSLFSYCKSQAFTLNTLWSFLQNICPKHIFRFSREGGGINFNISSSFYFHFVIKFRLLLSICGLHFWCPLNLKMLPTPLYIACIIIGFFIFYLCYG